MIAWEASETRLAWAHGPQATLPALMVAASVLFFALASAAAAQGISGTVSEDGSGIAVAQAEVRLLNSAGAVAASVITDPTGAFRVDAPAPGDFTLQVTHLSFAPFTSSELTLDRGATTLVEVRLTVRAIALEPLTVVGRRYMDDWRLREFYDRADVNLERGVGRVYLREDLDGMAHLDEIFFGVPRRPYLIAYSRVSCIFEYYMNGMPMGVPDGGMRSMGSPMEYEGIEVYWGGNIPIKYRRNPGTCGVVLLWNRPARKPFTWRRMLLAGVIGGLFFLIN